MLNFDFYSPARILFGKGEEKRIGELLKPHAGKVLLHYGGGSIKRSGLYDTVTDSLKESGLPFVELGGVKPNPRLSLVQEGIALCRNEGVDLLLAVGGGSTIDSAKAIAMGVYYEGNIWEVYEQGKAIDKALPVATILTIPAAGSESSGDTVITNEERQLKYGYGSPRLRPLFSIMNPELFFTLPKDQLSNGVADMMSHVFERYFTNTTHTDLTDGLCETVLKTMMKNAPLALANPQDYDAWCELGFSGTVAHNGLVGMGRQQDWACHKMEHELSAIYDVAHGAGLAVLTPGWMQYVYKDNINMFVQFAVNVMGVEGSYREPDAIVSEGIDRVREFFRKMGLPATLSELGIGEDKLEEMAKKATGAVSGEEKPIGGLKKLHWQDVLEIYRSVK
ncbi:iron-containing alcohol dehydrogenase [Anaerotalea alkaliphila]|uniref:Iron-containing alcohol dehydrogenase n=1 Tax=Anaerotalea alkaliphila TaxID=2662126 RepID=A0A7X5HXQ4_9FIRM|nr:iron-containing alcohol dehydrogenase [Anaerotalea alkaliphila]NDL68550.1 iron-containing alcohol dehydrogenase [Anaerotalea alkaliphila]